MTKNVVVISNQESDLEFGKTLAAERGLEFLAVTKREELRSHLAATKDALVFWDADNPTSYDSMGEILPKYSQYRFVFAITETHLENYPHLYKYPIFGHHILRRYDTPATQIYSRLAAAAIADNFMGPSQFLPEAGTPAKLTITQLSHKRAAVEAIQNSLVKKGVRPRIAHVVTQATDELLLNAIFTAATLSNGTPFRKEMPRDGTFDLLPGEQIEVELGFSTKYNTVTVSDTFGSLKKNALMESLRGNFEKRKQGGEKGADLESVAIGLHGVSMSGVSILATTDPGNRTEVTLFYPQTESFKEFREAFRFFSIIAPNT